MDVGHAGEGEPVPNLASTSTIAFRMELSGRRLNSTRKHVSTLSMGR